MVPILFLYTEQPLWNQVSGCRTAWMTGTMLRPTDSTWNKAMMKCIQRKRIKPDLGFLEAKSVWFLLEVSYDRCTSNWHLFGVETKHKSFIRIWHGHTGSWNLSRQLMLFPTKFTLSNQWTQGFDSTSYLCIHTPKVLTYSLGDGPTAQEKPATTRFMVKVFQLNLVKFQG